MNVIEWANQAKVGDSCTIAGAILITCQKYRQCYGCFFDRQNCSKVCCDSEHNLNGRAVSFPFKMLQVDYYDVVPLNKEKEE